MSVVSPFVAMWNDLLTAVQFLTRIPVVPSRPYDVDSLARAVRYFPLVGLLLGLAGACLHALLFPHLPRMAASLLVLIFVVLMTGALHEDGLADTADGLGGGRSREQMLTIMHDSRIGSYGVIALVGSFLLRAALLSSLPVPQVWQYLICAHLLCRWTAVPLSCYLPSARAGEGNDTRGQGARIAQRTSQRTVMFVTVFSFLCAALLLRRRSIAPIVVSLLVVILSGQLYMRKLGGITGDCFGATNQVTEVMVYLCGVWAA